MHGQAYHGVNVYGVLRAPRADGSESLVLSAPLRSKRGQWNLWGVALALTMARFFAGAPSIPFHRALYF